MKPTLLLLFTCWLSLVMAQENTYTLRIIDTQNRPMKNVVVTSENAAANIVLKATTDQDGKAVFKLPEPGTYLFSYLELKEVAKAEVKEGYYGEFTRTVTYDPKGKFAPKARADRGGIAFKQVAGTQLKGQPKIGEVTIVVKQQNGTVLPNIPVKLVSIAEKTKYSATSNASGKAVFYVPVGVDYEVDVEQNEAFHQFNVPNYEGLEMTEVVFYEKTKVQEITKGDTIIQQAITQTTGTSTHVLFTLQLNDYEGVPLANEPVYMSALGSKRVYKGTTDLKGKCAFMLEKGSNYAVNLKHEQNIHLVEAPAGPGFKTASATRRYRGSAVIEQILAEQREEMRRAEEEMKRIEEQLKKEAAEFKKTAMIQMPPVKLSPTYNETSIEPLSAPVNYVKKTTQGYDIDFEGESGMISTPTMVENKLYTLQGLYSPNYYCLQAQSGGFVWGVALGETGISPAVYHKGVLLINTASCTLYAIDAASGKLLWSKWLAGYVYSTPTAADDDVYVVYNHGGKPVLVAFDLRSGNFKWMQYVDNEAIACPVVDGEEVHVASQSGTYYVFNRKTGVRTASTRDIYVLSSPAISGDKIFVTARVGSGEKLVALDRKTLAVKQTFDTPLEAFKTTGNRNVDHIDQMNFNGSHPVVYQNKVVIVTDLTHIYAFDATTEKQLWSQPIQVSPEQVPVVANGKVYIISHKGDVMAYDLMAGTPQTIQKGSPKDRVEGQPVSGNGFLYFATAGVLQAIKALPGIDWKQWNKDAGHNTVWK